MDALRGPILQVYTKAFSTILGVLLRLLKIPHETQYCAYDVLFLIMFVNKTLYLVSNLHEPSFIFAFFQSAVFRNRTNA